MSGQLVTINMEIVEESKQLMGERFSTMIKYFLEDTEMYISEIDKAVEEKNPDIATAPAHTIKSSAKQIGAEKVSDTAKRIEELCRKLTESDNSKNEYESNFVEFESLCTQLKEEMEEVIPELNAL